jgi:hypothetical protein
MYLPYGRGITATGDYSDKLLEWVKGGQRLLPSSHQASATGGSQNKKRPRVARGLSGFCVCIYNEEWPRPNTAATMAMTTAAINNHLPAPAAKLATPPAPSTTAISATTKNMSAHLIIRILL